MNFGSRNWMLRFTSLGLNKNFWKWNCHLGFLNFFAFWDYLLWTGLLGKYMFMKLLVTKKTYVPFKLLSFKLCNLFLNSKKILKDYASRATFFKCIMHILRDFSVKVNHINYLWKLSAIFTKHFELFD